MDSAARCAELTGLGYIGVDMVLDRGQGPLILELNARPGLNIQIANGRGLAGRRDHVVAAAPADAGAAGRVQWSREAFAHAHGR